MEPVLLKDLPSPPSGRSGWPWTEGSAPVPARRPDGSPWLRLTVVTASYNQGQYLEETIRSVLLQGYPNLEYIIIDGGSTDITVDVIRKYEKWIDRWVSEKDRGMSHALNKGYDGCSGELLAWINSDDYYMPNTFATACGYFHDHPETDFLWSNNCGLADGVFRLANRKPAFTLSDLLFTRALVNQETSFWRKSLAEKAGKLDEALHYAMDYDLWLRMFRKGKVAFLPEERFGVVREHDSRKSSRWQQYAAEAGIVRRRTLASMGIPRIFHKTLVGLAYRFKRFRQKRSLRLALQRTEQDAYMGIRGRFF